jgi:HEAT repeat protein/ATP/ADP translocase
MIERLQQTLQIRKGEGRLVLAIAALFLLISLGIPLTLETATALFNTRASAAFLPQMYILLGLTNIVFSLLHTVGLSRIPKRIYFIFVLALITVVLYVERTLIPTMEASTSAATLLAVNPIFPVLWITAFVITFVAGPSLGWNIAGELLNQRQAKRLFPLFSSASILGLLLGDLTVSLSTTVLSDLRRLIDLHIGLLLVSIVVMIVISWAYLPKEPRRAKRRITLLKDLNAGAQVVFSSRLLRLVAFSLLLFTLLYFALEFPFNTILTEARPQPAAQLAFKGTFNWVSRLVAFAVSLFLANRVISRLGTVNARYSLILTYAAGFGVLFLYPSLTTVTAVKFLQVVTLSGITASVDMVFFNVIPAEKRAQAMTFTNGVIGQVGTFLSGVFLFAGASLANDNQAVIFLAGLVIATLLVGINIRMHRAYKDALTTALQSGHVDVFEGQIDQFSEIRGQADPQVIQQTLDALNSEDPLIRKLAAEILGRLHVTNAEGLLLARLRDENESVREAALGALVEIGSPHVGTHISSLIFDESPSVQIKALHYYPHYIQKPLAVNLRWVHKRLNDGDLGVQSAAVRALIRFGDRKTAAKKLILMLGHRGGRHRQNALDLFIDLTGEGLLDAGPVVRFLPAQWVINKLDDLRPMVRARACQALSAYQDAGHIPLLAEKLNDPVPEVRRQATIALAAYPEARTLLADALLNPNLRRAQPFILAALREPDDDTLKAVNQFIQNEIETLRQWLKQRKALQLPGRGFGFLNELIDDYIHQTEMLLIRAAGVLEPEDAAEWESIIENLATGDPDQRAAALEMMDTIGDTLEVKRLILPILDDPDTLSIMREGETALSPFGAILQLLTLNDAWAIALALTSAAELGLENFTAEIERFLNHEDPLVRDAAHAALLQLGGDTMPRKTLNTLSTVERVLLLKELYLFKDLEVYDLKRLADLAYEQVFNEGEALLRQNEEGAELFVLAAGAVDVRVSADGVETSVAELGAGDYVGEMAILDMDIRSASAYAIGTVRALVIDGVKFKAILRDRPEVSLAVLKGMARRIRQMNDQIAEANR